MVEITLRQVTVQDLELILAWRSNPNIYENFREQDGPLDWEEHVTWYATRPPKRKDLMIEYNGRRVGVVSIAADGDTGVYIGEVTSWGKGIAEEALRQACQVTSDRKLTAQIHEDNGRSQRLFEKCGFEKAERQGEWLLFRYEEE